MVGGQACQLSPVGPGRMRFPGGKMVVIPTWGISLANTGLPPNATCYVYLTEGGALEASGTGYVMNGGYACKSGDSTRLLVGKTLTDTSGLFVNNPRQRYVLSYFNRKNMMARGLNATNRSTTSTTPVEAFSAEEWTRFICWAGAYHISINAAISNLGAANTLVSPMRSGQWTSNPFGVSGAPGGTMLWSGMSFFEEFQEDHYYLTLYFQSGLNTSTAILYANSNISILLEG